MVSAWLPVLMEGDTTPPAVTDPVNRAVPLTSRP